MCCTPVHIIRLACKNMDWVLDAYYSWYQGNTCSLPDAVVRPWQGHQLQVILCSSYPINNGLVSKITRPDHYIHCAIVSQLQLVIHRSTHDYVLHQVSDFVSLPWYSCWEGRSDIQANTLDLSGHSWNLMPNCTLQDWPQLHMFSNCWKTKWKRVCDCWKTYPDVIFGFIRLRGHCNNRSEVTRLQICCSHSTLLWTTYHAYDGHLPLTIISIASTPDIRFKSRNPIARKINVKGKHL